jgi:hypothetical protein
MLPPTKPNTEKIRPMRIASDPTRMLAVVTVCMKVVRLVSEMVPPPAWAWAKLDNAMGRK